MKTKLLALSLLMVTTTSNALAATIKSATTPLNGTYNYVGTEQCTADVNSSIPATYASSYTHAKAGQRAFTPDTAAYSVTTNQQALTIWLTSKSLVSPSPVMNVTQDPTALAGVNFAEIPIQWGIIKQSTIQSDVTFPYTVVPTTTNYIESAYSVLTKYTYSNSALTNGVTTGYAIYRQNNIGTPWVRLQIFTNAFSATSLSASTNVILLAHHSEQKLIGSQNYIFNCGSKINMIR